LTLWRRVEASRLVENDAAGAQNVDLSKDFELDRVDDGSKNRRA